MTQARSRRQLELKEGWVKAGARVSTQQSSEGIISHTGEAPCWWPGNLQRRSFSPRFHRPLRCLQTPECLLKSANVQVGEALAKAGGHLDTVCTVSHGPRACHEPRTPSVVDAVFVEPLARPGQIASQGDREAAELTGDSRCSVCVALN